MRPEDYLAAVETAFRLSKAGQATSPSPLHIAGMGGGFHAKGAALMHGGETVAVKINANFPENSRSGRPTIQGVIALFDAKNGDVLAIMDSIEVTIRRTAAASALAARHLARRASETLTIVGCGRQARAHAEALVAQFPIKRMFVWDLDPEKSKRFALEMGAVLSIPTEVADNRQHATRASDIIVTCTTSRKPILATTDVEAGAFIAAVGADNSDKNEIAPNLLSRAKVVVDDLDQCLVMGDLHHAVEAGTMTRSGVHADLADVVTSAKPGRERADEIIVFDSTGTAIQDVASAAVIFERAAAASVGRTLSFQ